MLKITVECDRRGGKSTLAALIALKLTEVGIPCIIVDEGGASAGELVTDADRLVRNTAAIAGRETACGGKVAIVTRTAAP